MHTAYKYYIGMKYDDQHLISTFKGITSIRLVRNTCNTLSANNVLAV